MIYSNWLIDLYFSTANNIRRYKKNELFADNADQSELYKVEEGNSGGNNSLNLFNETSNSNKVKMVKHVALTENNTLLNESSSSLNFKYDSGNFEKFLLIT